jgi:hypothetical protein
MKKAYAGQRINVRMAYRHGSRWMGGTVRYVWPDGRCNVELDNSAGWIQRQVSPLSLKVTA